MQGPSRWRKEKTDPSRNRGRDILAAKRRALRHGRVAELIALVALIAKGYRPLGRRFSAAGGEIDLIMQRRDVIAFIEVKARRDLMDAVHAIDGRKRLKFSRAVWAWLQQNPAACACSLRCDAVYITGGWRPRHIEGAFELD